MKKPNSKQIFVIYERNIPLYEFDTLQEASNGMIELVKRGQWTWEDQPFKIRVEQTEPAYIGEDVNSEAIDGLDPR